MTATAVCLTRLRKEYKEIVKNPVDNIRAVPKDSNILEWHYVIEGPKGSIYEGGWYHGIVTFPGDYPHKPPSIQMLTPSGRFKIATRLCMSMSDFHPETWNPIWSVGTILMGLYSFMLEESPTLGSIVTTNLQKRQFAKASLEYNTKNKMFAELFPDLVERCEEERRKNAAILAANSVGRNTTASSSSSVLPPLKEEIDRSDKDPASWATILGVLCAIVACTWALLALSL